MVYLRSTYLRRLFAILIAFSSLSVQAEILFACNLMDGVPMTECCCGEDMNNGCQKGGGCEHASEGIPSGCCTISLDIDTGLSQATITATSHGLHIDLLYAPQPQPALVNLTATEIHATQDSNSIAKENASPDWSPGTLTYLVTHRFRI